jgi:hypothetical protein
MREAKFRGMSTLLGRWVYGGYIKHLPYTPSPIGGDLVKDYEYQHLIVHEGFSDWQMPRSIEAKTVIPESLGEFTGLKDGLGHEIYEGDILNVTSKNGATFVAPVGWFGKFGLSTFNSNPSYVSNKFLLEVGSLSLAISDGSLAVKVVGNVYENPELLEGDDNGF